jgi:hypothetical protein
VRVHGVRLRVQVQTESAHAREGEARGEEGAADDDEGCGDGGRGQEGMAGALFINC